MASPITTSLQNLQNTAEKLYPNLKGGEILALSGPLGSGKTTFTQKLAKKLKVEHKVTSPTFVIMNMFKGTTKAGKKVNIYHLDLYRTKNFREVSSLGITEFWLDKNAITIIEWAEKIKSHLPKNAIFINFQN